MTCLLLCTPVFAPDDEAMVTPAPWDAINARFPLSWLFIFEEEDVDDECAGCWARLLPWRGADEEDCGVNCLEAVIASSFLFNAPLSRLSGADAFGLRTPRKVRYERMGFEEEAEEPDDLPLLLSLLRSAERTPEEDGRRFMPSDGATRDDAEAEPGRRNRASAMGRPKRPSRPTSKKNTFPLIPTEE